MSIVAVCPHCLARYVLQPDLRGKAMRCNECRDIFTVQELEAQPPPLPVSPPYEKVEADPFYMPPVAERTEQPPPIPVGRLVLDAEPVHRAAPASIPVAKAIPLPAPKRRVKSRRTPPAVPDIEPREVAAEGPTEVAWSPEAEPPAAPPVQVRKPRREVTFDPDLLKKRGRNGSGMVLVGIIALIGLVGLGIAGKLIRDEVLAEERLAAAAADAFKEHNYPQAGKLYDDLLGQFGTSAEADRYKFFAGLSALRTAAGAVGLREDPAAAQSKFNAFLGQFADSPLAKSTDDAYGLDLYEIGQKIIDGYADHAADLLAKFRGARADGNVLAAAEAAVNDGRAMLPGVEKFRPKDAKPLAETRAKLYGLGVQFGRERERLTLLAPYRDLANDPTDQRIAAFADLLQRAGFATDAEARTLIDSAKTKLRGLIRAIPELRPPTLPPVDAAPTLLFVAPTLGQRPLAPNHEGATDIVFTVARGILYALDADNGEMLWATRVGRSVTELPARAAASEGGPEYLVSATDLGNRPGLVARMVRTGEAVWYQPLDAAVAGRPVIVGGRVYAPLRDEVGTIVEIDLASGNRLATLQLRQRVGPGAVLQPGTSDVFLAAEARRVFVLDVNPHDAAGERQPLKCVAVLATDHPDLSLRVPPAFAGPLTEGPRTLLLFQNDGTSSTVVRAFALPESYPTTDAGPPPEVPLTEAGTAKLPGHVWFPPAADGERIAVVTDAGAFALFGTNPPGNLDPGLFRLPSVTLPTDAKQPSPGQVVAVGEDSYWLIARSQRSALRVGFSPQAGLMTTLRGLPVPAGVPVHSPQVVARRGLAVALLRADESESLRAVAFDVQDGRVRWERAIGAVAATAPLPMRDGGMLLVDDAGGVFALPPTASKRVDAGSKPADAAWLIAPPVAAPAGTATVAADAETAWILIPEAADKAGRRLRVRKLLAGKLVIDTIVAQPESLAGAPLAAGDKLFLPLADGVFYRFDPASTQFLAGPMWRGVGVPADAVCFPARGDGEEILTTDGARGINRWLWTTEWKRAGIDLGVREAIAFAPLLRNRAILVADVTGVISMFDPARTEPVKRWRPTGDADGIPIGRPTQGFVNRGNDVIYAIDSRHLVALTPDADVPPRIVKDRKGADILGLTVGGETLFVTDLAGVVTMARGTTLREEQRVVGSLPRTAGIVFSAGRLLLPTADGGAIFLTVSP